MKGLVHYSDDSDTSPPPRHTNAEAGPSRRVNDGVSGIMDKLQMASTSSPKVPIIKPTQRQRPPGIKLHKPPPPSPSTKPPSPPKQQLDQTQNLTQASIETLKSSEMASEPTIQDEAVIDEEMGDAKGVFAGLSEEEIFRRVTRPDEIAGKSGWGIPDEVDPEECDDQLKTKVANFLRLKYERGQHINTTLLSSSSFANPHIYAKLVEFVRINETASAFPKGGWMTRQNIESLIPTYGPKALSSAQKAREEDLKKSQEAGKRSNISFVSGRADRADSSREPRDRDRINWDKERHNDSGGGRKRERERDRDRRDDRDGPGGYRARDSARDRQRERDHARERDRVNTGHRAVGPVHNGSKDEGGNGSGSGGGGRWSDRGR